MTGDDYYIADDVLQHRQQLQQWFQSDLGQALLQMEQQKIARILPDLFGYHILQLGYLEQNHLMASSRISHKLISTQPISMIR